MRPKCIVQGCTRNATRWDGGVCGLVVDNTTNRLKPGPIVWLCGRHDPGHNFFDLPRSLDAILELACLRDVLQENFVAKFKLEIEVADLRAKLKGLQDKE